MKKLLACLLIFFLALGCKKEDPPIEMVDVDFQIISDSCEYYYINNGGDTIRGTHSMYEKKTTRLEFSEKFEHGKKTTLWLRALKPQGSLYSFTIWVRLRDSQDFSALKQKKGPDDWDQVWYKVP